MTSSEHVLTDGQSRLLLFLLLRVGGGVVALDGTALQYHEDDFGSDRSVSLAESNELSINV